MVLHIGCPDLRSVEDCQNFLMISDVIRDNIAYLEARDGIAKSITRGKVIDILNLFTVNDDVIKRCLYFVRLLGYECEISNDMYLTITGVTWY